jgi:diguanylate cyclase (GGDEF)-like protein
MTMTRPRAARGYSLFGAALALAAPVGLLVARATGTLSTYAYVMVAAVVAYAMLGRLVGGRMDRAGVPSNTAPPTSLLDHRHFGQRLTDEIARSRRHGHPVCVLVLCLDVDRHALGAVSRALLGSVRGIDAVARIDGGELAVLLPETSLPHASVVATRILGEVSRQGPATGVPAVSIGIAELCATDTGPEDVLAAAGVALLQAKAAGGGRAAIGRADLAMSRARSSTLMEAASLLEADRHSVAAYGFGSLRRGFPPECPTCRRTVAEVCGNSLLQQSWFRLAGGPASCSAHRAEGSVSP